MSDEFKTKIQSIHELLKTPEKKASACLIVVSGRTSVGKMFKLDRMEMVIGRAADADIILDDDGVSRRHAKIAVRADGIVELVDLNSTNGTFNNGERIDTQALKDGDKIQIGSATILKFSYQDSLDEALQRNLYDSATRDGLTRIYNKKYFLDTFRKEFSYCARHRLGLSVVIFDVDHFKKINDTYGHQAGDFVLHRLAQKVGETLRAEDLLARYGGEEFVILVREAVEEKTLALAERVRRRVETTDFTFNGQRMQVTISAGVATLSTAAEFANTEDMIASADKHLYRAKQSGRNRVEGRVRTSGVS